jgi:hypothetical protein
VGGLDIIKEIASSGDLSKELGRKLIRIKVRVRVGVSSCDWHKNWVGSLSGLGVRVGVSSLGLWLGLGLVREIRGNNQSGVYYY